MQIELPARLKLCTPLLIDHGSRVVDGDEIPGVRYVGKSETGTVHPKTTVVYDVPDEDGGAYVTIQRGWRSYSRGDWGYYVIRDGAFVPSTEDDVIDLLDPAGAPLRRYERACDAAGLPRCLHPIRLRVGHSYVTGEVRGYETGAWGLVEKATAKTAWIRRLSPAEVLERVGKDVLA